MKTPVTAAGIGLEGSTGMLISVIIRIVMRLLRSSQGGSQDQTPGPVRRRRMR